ncbi:MAG: hypothetical protein RIQ89_1532 [Bacteroidota bacterium]
MRNWSYFLSLIPGLLTLIGNTSGGYWSWANLVFSFVVLAVLELVLPSNKHNEANQDNTLPNILLWLHVPLQLSCVASLIIGIANLKLMGHSMAGAVLSTGISSGSGAIVVAHELIHRKEKYWRFAGQLLLFSAGNFYFYVEHLKVHHKWVGTHLDPATSRYGESLYKFYIRTTIQQIRSAWNVEAQGLAKKNKSTFNFSNYVLTNILLHLLIAITVVIFLGAWSYFAFLLHALLANFLLEYINYIEHYGLSRNTNERCTEIHSWQSDKVVSRFFLIDLSRHSDHHYYASKPFHQLITYDRSPELPTGYASSIYLALLPPLWFKVMHARLQQYHQSNKIMQ